MSDVELTLLIDSLADTLGLNSEVRQALHDCETFKIEKIRKKNKVRITCRSPLVEIEYVHDLDANTKEGA